MYTGVRLKERTKTFAKKMEGIAHPIRLSILYLLAFKDFQLHELSEYTDYPPNLVSHHVGILYKTGWVVKKKWKSNVYYHIQTRMLFDWYRLFVNTPLETEFISRKLRTTKFGPASP